LVQKTVEKIGLPTRKDFEAIDQKIQDLSSRIKKMEEGK
jgi:hypothetical protein